MRLFLLFLTAFVANALADDSPEAPPVKDLGNGRYQLGEVTFDENSREISFPATVNMTEGLLEFAVVHEKGKIHESLLMTKASALNINLALKLLNYEESPELFPVYNEETQSLGDYPKVSEKVKTAARLRILVKWEQEGEEKEASLNEWIYHTPTEKAMEPVPWIYSGSFVSEGRFAAETTGDYFAIFKDPASMINFPGTDNDLDEVWIPTPEVIPPANTKVTLTLAPLLEKPASNSDNQRQ
ncbi:MAG: YdjY domain-containing protein [Verrucomicrobiota bacterium JB023]|nr:YdjY domain-containing protein [Verrucomicrobiota bacterium JB023]